MFGRSFRNSLFATTTIAIAMVGGVMLGGAPVVAQSSSQPKLPEFLENARPTSDHPAQKLVSVDFAGGTTQQYYDALQKALGQRVVVIMPGAGSVQMPAVKLTNVPFGEAVQIAKYVQSQRVKVESEGQTWIVVAVSDPVFGEDLPQTRTWPLAEVIGDGLSADALLSAVQAGLDLQGAQAKLRYHDETRVLFAQGSRYALQLVDQTLDSAKGSVRAAAKARDNEEIAQLRWQLDEANQRVRQLEQHIVQLEAARTGSAR